MAEIDVDEEITVTITGDFGDDPTIGGGMQIEWNPAVLGLIEWNPLDWGGDAAFFLPGTGDAANGRITGFVAGSFHGVFGPVLMATITFVGLAEGAGDVTLMVDPEFPFFGEDFVIQNPDFFNPDIRVLASQFVGGNSANLLNLFAACRNITTSQSLTLPGLRGAPDWDCSGEGLMASADDEVLQLVVGRAFCGSPGGSCDVAAEVTGVSLR